MGGEVITGIIQKHNKIEARNFLQIHEEWSFCDFYNRIFFIFFRRCCCSLALQSQTHAQFNGKQRFRKTSTRIPVQKYPIRKYGTKKIIYMKYTFTNSSYVVLHWKSWMKLISLIHFVCGPALGNHG